MHLSSFPDVERFRALAADYNVIPVAVQVLADLETPVSVLRRFQRHSATVFLLESVEGGERWGRYSFLGLSAHGVIRVYRDDLCVECGGDVRRVPHGGDPLSALRDVLSRYRLADMPERPRFCGGLVGYMCYEMAHFFEPRVPNRLPPDRPLAEFMIPDLLLVFDNVLHALTVMSLVFLSPGDDLDAVYATARQRVADLAAQIEHPVPAADAVADAADADLRIPRELVSAAEFRRRVGRLKDYIRQGDGIQTVLSQPFECDAPSDSVALYRAQRYVNPSPYMYYLRFGDRILVGSSPESMVRLEQRVACLRPIAGTRPRGADESADRHMADELLQDPKERAEHLMLVDLARNELGRVARAGSVQVTDLMVVERYSHVMHLVSNVVADLAEGLDGFDLIRSGFPAGTLSGAPKVRAMERIAEMETEPRGPYGGAVGYVAFNGNLDFAICIRTADIDGSRLRVQAGAGIVADSDPERERQETVNKARSVARALELLWAGNRPGSEVDA